MTTAHRYRDRITLGAGWPMLVRTTPSPRDAGVLVVVRMDRTGGSGMLVAWRPCIMTEPIIDSSAFGRSLPETIPGVIRDVRAGDKAAIDHFYRRYATPVF